MTKKLAQATGICALFTIFGCAGGWYKQQSSGQIGCPEDQIEVSNVDQGMTTKTWVATCKGKKFYCSSSSTGLAGGHTAACKEEMK